MASAHTNEDQDDLLILGSLRSLEKARSPGPKRLPGVPLLIGKLGEQDTASRMANDSAAYEEYLIYLSGLGVAEVAVKRPYGGLRPLES